MNANIRAFALVFGIIFLVVGIAGFIPALLAPPTEPLAINALHGRLLGLFPVNVLHSAVHVLFGIWGIAAYRALTTSILYARVVAIAYGVLTVFGLIPGLNTVFGLIPLEGNDVWLHFILAVVAAYFGFYAVRQGPVEGEGTEPRRRRATAR